MPEVSRFPPTHFHAIYAGHEALVEIETGAIHEGYLPGTAYDLVNQWRAIHLSELRDDWNRARQQLPLLPIAPLECTVPNPERCSEPEAYLITP